MINKILLIYHWIGRKISKRYYKMTCLGVDAFQKGMYVTGFYGETTKVFFVDYRRLIIYVIGSQHKKA